MNVAQKYVCISLCAHMWSVDLFILQGFGFVTFANSEDALKSKEHLNNKVIDGRKIEVGGRVGGR